VDKPMLVPNATTVLVKASSLWAAYGAFILDVSIKILQYMQDCRELKWQDMVVPILLLLVPAFRVIRQESITRAEKQPVPLKE